MIFGKYSRQLIKQRKHAGNGSFILILIIILLNSCNGFKSNKPGILVITGGHSYDTTEFFNFFLNLENYDVDTISQPQANQFLGSGNGHDYEALVFYDMWDEITEDQKEAYIELTRLGIPMLFLHHSLVSYQSWPEFINIIGGKYITEVQEMDSASLSAYRHDLDLDVRILDRNHPVTRGLNDFKIHDEGYSNLQILNSIQPLLATENIYCEKIIGWAHSYNNSDIVYLIFGHDRKAYEDPDFRHLVRNTLNWFCNEK